MKEHSSAGERAVGGKMRDKGTVGSKESEYVEQRGADIIMLVY